MTESWNRIWVEITTRCVDSVDAVLGRADVGLSDNADATTERFGDNEDGSSDDGVWSDFEEWDSDLERWEGKFDNALATEGATSGGTTTVAAGSTDSGKRTVNTAGIGGEVAKWVAVGLALLIIVTTVFLPMCRR